MVESGLGAGWMSSVVLTVWILCGGVIYGCVYSFLGMVAAFTSHVYKVARGIMVPSLGAVCSILFIIQIDKIFS